MVTSLQTNLASQSLRGPQHAGTHVDLTNNKGGLQGSINKTYSVRIGKWSNMRIWLMNMGDFLWDIDK
jgi:hypothetical protein